MAIIRDEYRLIDQASGALREIARSAGATAIELEQMGSSGQSAANQVVISAKSMDAEIKKAESSTNMLTRAWNTLKSAAVISAGIQVAKGIMTAADEQTTLNARIAMMNDGLQTTEQLQRMIYESAQRSRGAYSATANMVGRFGTLAPDAFGNSKEVVAFAEQINKHLTLSGASAQAGEAAILQLTQALGSGVLRGEELNSILEQTPTIAQAIAEYMGVSIGEMRELASEGQITADVVKNALFATAEETNAKFEEMPMTFAQTWQSAVNAVQQAAMPALNAIAKGATIIHDNWDTIAPILISVAVAAGILAAGYLGVAAATAIATAAQSGFIAALLANPLTPVFLALVLIVGVIYDFIQACGGLTAAWLTAKNWVLTGVDELKIGFMSGVFAVLNWLDSMNVAFFSVSISIANAVGDMKVNVLTLIQDMVNGAIGLINDFISAVNNIPGVAIGLLDEVTFAASAAASNEAAKSARGSALEALKAAQEANKAARADEIADMRSSAKTRELERLGGIAAARTSGGVTGGGGTSDLLAGLGDIPSFGTGGSGADIGDVGKVGSVGSVKSIEGDVKLSDEDMKIYRDLAERRYMNEIELKTLAPNINVTLGEGANAKNLNPKDVANAIAKVLAEQRGGSTSVVHA